MNTSFSRVAPAARRLVSSRSQGWARTASNSFGSIVSRNTAVPTAFATTYQSKSSFSSKLTQCLATEITSELAEDEVDQEYLDSKKQIEKLFTITSEVGEGIVSLKRQYEDETIEVTFDCQDEAEMDMDMDDNELETADEDNDEGPAMEIGINFDLKVTKPSGDKIVITCVASRKLIVRSVRYLPAGKDIDDPSVYGGPIFEQLNEELQDSFYDYLAERNIDEDLSFFVLSYSRIKENTEYSNWLQKVMAFSDTKE